MIRSANIFKAQELSEDGVKKVTLIATDELAVDTYYFKPGQVLDYHRHPNGDQIFIIQKGEGSFYLDDGSGEEVVPLEEGSVILAPKGVWHKLVNERKDVMIASQATKQPAGHEKK